MAEPLVASYIIYWVDHSNPVEVINSPLPESAVVVVA